MKRLLSLFAMFTFTAATIAGDPWITLPGGEGPGKGKKVVLISGDEEYRSEEMLPALAKILSKHHGFDCTVLFAIDPKDGCIQPNVNNNIPGLEKLKDADLMVIFTRFRNLPDDQMKHFVTYLESGKPIVGFRTATHAFNINGKSDYTKYTWGSKLPGYEGGFGKQVLGETWVAHHGKHGTEGTRGVPAKGQEGHAILKGIKPRSIFGTTDVYTVKPLAASCVALVLGEVTETLQPDSKAVDGKKNDPMMPVAWTNNYKGANRKETRVFTSTMGCGEDFLYEGTRKLFVNGIYWTLAMEGKIPDSNKVDLVGDYKPTKFKAKKNEDWKPGIKPEDLK